MSRRVVRYLVANIPDEHSTQLS